MTDEDIEYVVFLASIVAVAVVLGVLLEALGLT